MVALAYIEEGSGFPLLMGSSLGTDSRLWAPLAVGLVGEHRVIRYDHRGHGRSPVPAGDYTLEQIATDALELMDSLDIECTDYCGVSMGGMVGMWLASHHPARIRRLVLANTSAYMAPRQPWLDRAELVRAEGMAAVAPVTMERWFTPQFLDDQSREVASVRAQLLETDPQGYAACAVAISEMDLRDDLALIASPTLVIVADDDPSTPPSHGELIANSVANSELMGIPGRHLACIEAPTLVLPAIANFLHA
jgi:3-oxoadipate enol-lactonase